MIFRHILILACVLFALGETVAQVNHEQLKRPDTLNVVERLAISTNVADWALMLPNISLEYDLRGVTWNHWSVGVKVRGNWQTRHTYKPAQVYNLMEARAEVRYYWRTRETNEYFPAHDLFPLKLISCRRKQMRHPNTTYYRGLYVSHDNFSMLLHKTGYQGEAIGVGFLYGIIKPLYQYNNGNTLDLELGISGGLYYAQYHKYWHDRESDCYASEGKKDWHLLPLIMPNDLHLSLVYRFTDTPKHHLTERYRWRFDVDEAYRDTIIARYNRAKEIREAQAEKMRNLGTIEEYFDKVYNDNYTRFLNDARQKAANEPQENKKKAEKQKKGKKGGQS